MQHFRKRKEKLMRTHSKTRLHCLLVGHHATAWWSDIQNVKTLYFVKLLCDYKMGQEQLCVCVSVCVYIYIYVYTYIYIYIYTICSRDQAQPVPAVGTRPSQCQK